MFDVDGFKIKINYLFVIIKMFLLMLNNEYDRVFILEFSCLLFFINI